MTPKWNSPPRSSPASARTRPRIAHTCKKPSPGRRKARSSRATSSTTSDARARASPTCARVWRRTERMKKWGGLKSAPLLHYHMGLWTDDKGSVYVAVGRERLALKARDDGAGVVVARSRGDWSPSGGMFDRDGALWLLEYSSTNAVRVRRIARDGS